MAGFSSSTVGQARRHDMRFGASFHDGAAKFSIWAPSAQSLKLCLYSDDATKPEQLLDMQKSADGWWTRTVGGAQPGQQYQYVIGDLRVPDPASRFQADSVHGPSVLMDPASFNWSDSGWHGKAWEEIVLYEIHVGTFTQEGTFRGVVDKARLFEGAWGHGD